MTTPPPVTQRTQAAGFFPGALPREPSATFALRNGFAGVAGLPAFPAAIGLQDVVLQFLQYARTVATVSYAAIFACFTILFFTYYLGNIFGVGVNSVLMVPLRRLAKRFDDAVESVWSKTGVGSNPFAYLTYRLLRWFVVLVPRLLYGVLRFFVFLFATFGVLASLVFLYFIFIQVVADPYLSLQTASTATSVFKRGYNGFGGFYNLILDFSDHVLFQIANVYIYQTVQFIRIIYNNVYVAINNPDGTLLAYLGKSIINPSEQATPPKLTSVTGSFGGRRLQDTLSFTNGENAGIQLPDTIAVVDMTTRAIAFFIDLYLTFYLIIIDLIAGIIVPVFVAIAPALRSFVQSALCVATNSICGFRELGQILVTLIIGLLNTLLSLVLQGLSFFGVSSSANLIPVPNFACTQRELNRVSCKCADFFSNVPACGVAKFDCSQDAQGYWHEVQVFPDGTRQVRTTDYNRAVACPSSGRLLSSQPHAEMERQFGSIKCVEVCVNGTVALSSCGDGVVTHLGECQSALHGDRRRLGATSSASIGDFMTNVFGHPKDMRPVVMDKDGKKINIDLGADAQVDTDDLLAKRARDTVRAAKGDLRARWNRDCNPESGTAKDAFDSFAQWFCISNHGLNNLLKSPELTRSMVRRLDESADVADVVPHRFKRASAAALRLVSFLELRVQEFGANAHLPMQERVAKLTRPMQHAGHRSAYRRLREENVYFHFPNSHAVDSISRNIGRMYEEFRQHMSSDYESFSSEEHDGRSFGRYRRRELQQATRSPTTPIYGIFTPPVVCSPGLYLCPGADFGTGCVADKRRCQLPPNPSAGVWWDYQFLQLEIYLDDFDAVQFINTAGACWQSYETNPDSNPYLFENILVPGSYQYCLPLIQPVPFGRFKKMTYDFLTWVADACAGPNEPCSCPWYSTGLLTPGAYTYRGVPAMIVANFRDGFGALWILFTYVTTWNTFLAEAWTAAWSPMRPVVAGWWLHFFDGLDQPGDDTQILFCAGLHFPAVFVCLLFVLFVYGSIYAAFWVLYSISKDAMEIIFGVPFCIYETFFNANRKRKINSQELKEFFEERFTEFENVLLQRFSYSSSTVYPSRFGAPPAVPTSSGSSAKAVPVASSAATSPV